MPVLPIAEDDPIPLEEVLQNVEAIPVYVEDKPIGITNE
jgi:hypothetical protein